MSRANPILSSWDLPDDASLRSASSGLINETHLVMAAGSLFGVLQRLNTDIFVPAVHEDIEAVTRHLLRKGLATPLLVRTRSGLLWATDDDGGVWRLLTPVGDRTIDKLDDPEDARRAGTLVARFHSAVSDLDWQFRSVRVGAQDTRKHLDNLESALRDHRDHRLYEAVAPLAEAVLEAGRAVTVPDLPTRIIHGDLKISNVRFTGPQATALIDLDTLAHGTLEVELGDALRSWCNPASEDSTEARFDLGIFEAALRGYASAADGVTEAEWHSIVGGVGRITLNLTARFAADALQESYFGWNPEHGSRGDHNLLRAHGQWSLWSALEGVRGEANDIVAALRPA